MKIKGCPEPEEKGDCFERFHHAWKYGKIMVQPNGKPDDPDQTMDGSGGCLPRHKWKRKGKRKWKMEMEMEMEARQVRYVPPPLPPPLLR